MKQDFRDKVDAFFVVEKIKTICVLSDHF